jgi:hypothetical protein
MSIVEDCWQAIWNSLVHAFPLLSSIDLVVSTNKLHYMAFFYVVALLFFFCRIITRSNEMVSNYWLDSVF